MVALSVVGQTYVVSAIGASHLPVWRCCRYIGSRVCFHCFRLTPQHFFRYRIPLLEPNAIAPRSIYRSCTIANSIKIIACVSGLSTISSIRIVSAEYRLAITLTNTSMFIARSILPFSLSTQHCCRYWLVCRTACSCFILRNQWCDSMGSSNNHLELGYLLRLNAWNGLQRELYPTFCRQRRWGYRH